MLLLQGFVLLLLSYLLYKYLLSNSKEDKTSGVPGPAPSSSETGNLDDIGEAGSLHEYLLSLHQKFGGIVSFHMGKDWVVSISTPELFKENMAAFNRPVQLFKLFEPLIGAKSIQFANGEDIRFRRKHYDRAMSHKAVNRYVSEFDEVAQEMVKKLAAKLSEEYHLLGVIMSEYVLKVDLIAMFGSTSDDSTIALFHDKYDICWDDMIASLTQGTPAPGSPRDVAFREALEHIQSFVREIVAERSKMEITEEHERLVDILMSVTPDQDTLVDDALTYLVAAFHTMLYAVEWTFYFIAKHPTVQDRMVQEIREVLGPDGAITPTTLPKLRYVRQVLDESLRWGVVGTVAARFSDEETQLGGYTIPPSTTVIQAIGVSFQDPNYYPDPEVWDPDRFNPENTKQRPTLSFQPFGFAGRRMCPGYRFANTEALVLMVAMVRKFRVGLVPGHPECKRVYGFVTHPSEEIQITLQTRH